jgi:hypothetical protein
VERFGANTNNIYVINNGPVVATNVVVNVTVTSGNVDDPNLFMMNGNVGVWNIGNLNAGSFDFSRFDFKSGTDWSFTMTLTSSTPLCSGSVTTVTVSGPTVVAVGAASGPPVVPALQVLAMEYAKKLRALQ